MKQLLHTTVCLLIGAIIVSCDIETSDNGKLDGNWQLLTVTYNREGSYDSLIDVKAKKIFWGVQFKLVQIRILGDTLLDDAFGEFVAKFQHRKDSFLLPEIYVQFRNKDSLLPSDSKHLRLIGIEGNKAEFHIKKISKEKMWLQSDYAQLSFRKF